MNLKERLKAKTKELKELMATEAYKNGEAEAIKSGEELTAAIEEINATTDITVSVEEVREEGTTGKMKTVGYRFHLKEKTHEEKQIIMGTWGIPFEDILMLEEGQRPDFKDLEQEPDLPFKCDE